MIQTVREGVYLRVQYSYVLVHESPAASSVFHVCPLRRIGLNDHMFGGGWNSSEDLRVGSIQLRPRALTS